MTGVPHRPDQAVDVDHKEFFVTDTVYDMVVLGAGSGGYAAALRGAQLGLSVALIEADKVGGTCLHRGCVPTKALLHAAETADAVREAAAVGVRAAFEGVDMPGVQAYKNGIVSRMYKGLQGLVSSRGIDLVRGWGRLVDASTVEVDGRRVTGRNVVLASGSCARTMGRGRDHLRAGPGDGPRAGLGRRAGRRGHWRGVRLRVGLDGQPGHHYRGPGPPGAG